MINKYVESSPKPFQLSLESLVWFFSRFCDEEITENELADTLMAMSYQVCQRGCDIFFYIKFIRDIRTEGLFDYYDTSECDSYLLKTLIYNAVNNEDTRMRQFCDYAIHQAELCSTNVNDNDIIDYLQWMSRHSPSPKSTLAAVTLSQLSMYHENMIMNLSPDQLQFIRENPDLKLDTKICK